MVELDPDEVARKRNGEAARWTDPGRRRLERGLTSIQVQTPTPIIPGPKCDHGSPLGSITHRQSNAPGIKTFYDTCCLNRRSRVGVSEVSFLLVGAAWYGPGND